MLCVTVFDVVPPTPLQVSVNSFPGMESRTDWGLVSRSIL
jgi:hypothetical protein